jgi:anti-sigma factor RsiW
MSETRHAIEPEEIMAYLDGELAPGRAAEAMTHLDRCPECQRLVADLRRVSQELTVWQVETAGVLAPAFEPAKPMHHPLRMGLPAWAFAAVAAALVLGLMLISRNKAMHQESAVAFSLDGQPATDQVSAGDRLSARFTPLPVPAATPPPQATGQLGTTAPGPMIERTAQLTLTTHDFDQLRARIDAILARHHGYLAQLSVNAPETSGRSLNANLRIPAAQLDSALAEFKQLGRADSESQNGQDVSKQYVDLIARLANARNTAQRLTQLLAQRTGKLSDVLAVETELGRVQGEIEQMEAERKNTESQVAYAALQLNASEYYKAQLRVSPESTLLRLRNAAVEGYRSMADGVIGAALFMVACAPSVLLWAALLFFPLRALWRRYVARRSALSRSGL